MGTGISVSTAMTVSGADAGNYTLTQPALTTNITAKELTVGGTFTANNKQYDGSNTAVITQNNLTLAGIVGTDEVTVSRGGEVDAPEGGTVLGSTTEITTDIVGTTQVTIPLEGISIPADPEARAAFLESLAVFTYHSDGETELITGEIVYDASGNPVSISFSVDKFSTFAVVKLSKRTVDLAIGSTAGSLNGLAVTLDAPPFVDLKSNRTLAPLRFVSEALGAKVEWNSTTRQVKIKDGDKEIILTLDSQVALINGQSEQIDCTPVLAPPGRSFLPLRFISETLGAEVAYDDVTKRITITREYGD